MAGLTQVVENRGVLYTNNVYQEGSGTEQRECPEDGLIILDFLKGGTRVMAHYISQATIEKQQSGLTSTDVRHLQGDLYCEQTAETFLEAGDASFKERLSALKERVITKLATVFDKGEDLLMGLWQKVQDLFEKLGDMLFSDNNPSQPFREVRLGSSMIYEEDNAMLENAEWAMVSSSGLPSLGDTITYYRFGDVDEDYTEKETIM